MPRPVALCVLGHPVAHSLSPAMHGAALRAAGHVAVYHAFDVPPDRLAAALHGLTALGFRGANLTVPHKEQALPLLDAVDPVARALGAVNTVSVAGGRSEGHNTDGDAFLRSVAEEAGWRPAGRRAVVLGAGGAARAVVGALVAGGARVTVANRTPGRAAALARDLGADAGGGLQAGWLDRADLLVNCTAAGMWPQVDESPLAADLLDRLPAACVVADVVYNPARTRLLAAAAARGLPGVGGAGMLAWQGALAWRWWFGETGPVRVMRAALDEVLRRPQRGAPET